MNTETMFSSQVNAWETPHDLYEILDHEFDFEWDVCCTSKTAKAVNYFTPGENALEQKWVGVCWMNPPYGREIVKWMAKATFEAGNGCTVVCLVPARTDTKWWWLYCRWGEVRFLRGRLKFLKNGNTAFSAPFPSAIVVFGDDINPGTKYWDWRKYPRQFTYLQGP
jgi:phage N-6-adenine-methyltransferase